MPEPLFFSSRTWEVALMGISIDNTVLNVEETKFTYRKQGHPVKEVSILEGHMDTIDELLQHIRVADPKIEFVIANGRIFARFPNDVTLTLSENLQKLTGFPKVVKNGTISFGYDMYATCCPMMVKASLCDQANYQQSLTAVCCENYHRL